MLEPPFRWWWVLQWSYVSLCTMAGWQGDVRENLGCLTRFRLALSFILSTCSRSVSPLGPKITLHDDNNNNIGNNATLHWWKEIEENEVSLDTAPAWLPHPHVTQQSCAEEESFSKNLSLFKLLTLEALPHGILPGNEPQCINTFNSQYHSVHGAYIIQLLTSLKATCPYFSSCQKLAMEKFISNQT